MMIDLKEKFGDKYRVMFDRERYSADINVIPPDKRDNRTNRAWYYYLPCKKGKKATIEIYNEKDELALYCYSVTIGRRLVKQYKKQIIEYDMGRDVVIIYFKFDDYKIFFKEIEPKMKKKISEEQKQILRERLAQMRAKRENDNVY